MSASTRSQEKSWLLVSVIQELSLARSNEAVRDIVKVAARQLVDADGATFVLKDNGRCYYIDEDAIGPLWKGSKFPMEICISGWAMLNKRPAVIPDVFADDRIPHDVYRQTFVHSLVMTPIRQQDPFGAIGVYWAREYQATDEEVLLLQALADTTAVALENIETLNDLEQRVADRTAALDQANEKLMEMSLTDELTGVRNRRGFYMLAEHELGLIRRQGIEGSVAFIDMDGLKDINDTYGHEAGSEAIATVARVLRAQFRETDVIGRVGGDEFAVMIVNPQGQEAAMLRRLDSDLAEVNAMSGKPYRLAVSSGFVDGWAADDFEGLMAAADEAMYREKKAKQNPL